MGAEEVVAEVQELQEQKLREHAQHPPPPAPHAQHPPPPAPAHHPPAPQAPSSGGMMSGLMGSMASGMATGVGMSMGGRLVDSIFGGRKTEVVHRHEGGPPAEAPAANALPA